MLNLPLDKTITLTLFGRDSKRNRVTPIFDTAPVWTNSDDTVATIAPTPDGSAALVTPVALGQTKVSVTAIVGGNTLSASVDVPVAAGAIVAIDIDEALNP